jgi:hypothetical protein
MRSRILFILEKTPDQEDYSDYADAGGQDGEIGKSSDVPEFITTNQTIEAVIGQKLNIGCQVNKLDHTQVRNYLHLFV